MNEFVPASHNTYPKRKGKPSRVDLDVSEFDELLEDQGTRVRITASVVCPNKTTLEDTNHKLDCPLCYGSQVIDMCETAVEDWVYIQSIKKSQQFDPQGIFDLKDAQITFRQNVRVNYWYKIEVVDFASLYNQLIKRSSTNPDVDFLRYPMATSCDTPIHLLDKDGVRYTINEHYRIDGRDLRWMTATRPPSGSIYTINYPVLPTFRVLEILHDNRYYYVSGRTPNKTPVNLPQQAHIRLDYLANKAGTNILVNE